MNAGQDNEPARVECNKSTQADVLEHFALMELYRGR